MGILVHITTTDANSQPR